MEFWDIYDVNKERTGRLMKRNDWNMQPGDYHLTVLGIVTDEKGRFLITQRKADKEWAPLSWEIPGGGVKAGENSRDAVIREVSEETGLCLDHAEIRLVETYRNDSPEEKNNYFVDIYHVQAAFTEADVHTQVEETEGFSMASLDEVRTYGEAGKFLHYKRLLAAMTTIAGQK